MTTFYTATGNPVTLSRGASGLIRTEFGLIQAGFVSVNADIAALTSASAAAVALKGNITNQTWLGTHAFPATTSIGTVTAAEIARLSGLTSGAQAQFDNITGTLIPAKGAITGQVWSGAHDFSAGTLSAASPVSNFQVAIKSYVDAAALGGSLPGQTGNNRKFPTTDGTTAAWDYIGLDYEARTSNTILVQADDHKLIDVTTAGFTQTFTAAATLGAGWHARIRNSSTGELTLDPNSTELIDGLSTYVMYPGEIRDIYCTGTAFVSVVIAGFTYGTSTSFTFVKPPGYTSFDAILVGAGGGGGGGGRFATSSARHGGGGGAGGAIAAADIPASSLAASVSVSVGAGGTAGAAQTANDTQGGTGGTGGNTTIDTFLLARGGGGGVGGANGATAGGTAGTSYPTSTINNPTAGGAGNGSNAGTSLVGAYAPTGGGGGAKATGSDLTPIAGGAGGAITAASGVTSGRNVAVAASAGGTTGGTQAVAGTAGTSFIAGTGGGGGFYITATPGGTGAPGGAPGGGGGGGGASDNGQLSGIGGVGGNGYAFIRGVI